MLFRWKGNSARCRDCSSAQSLLDAGKIKPIALMTKDRPPPWLSDRPTLSEMGFRELGFHLFQYRPIMLRLISNAHDTQGEIG